MVLLVVGRRTSGRRSGTGRALPAGHGAERDASAHRSARSARATRETGGGRPARPEHQLQGPVPVFRLNDRRGCGGRVGRPLNRPWGSAARVVPTTKPRSARPVDPTTPRRCEVRAAGRRVAFEQIGARHRLGPGCESHPLSTDRVVRRPRQPIHERGASYMVSRIARSAAVDSATWSGSPEWSRTCLRPPVTNP